MPREWRAGRSVTIETTGTEIEEQIAHRFEQVLDDEGITLGPRERRDGRSGLRVDFVYERDPPGTALEITRLVAGAMLELSNLLLKMEQRLDQVAKDEDLGYWMIAVRERSTLRTLEPALTAFLRSLGQVPVATFASWDAKLDAQPLPQELARLGLLSAIKMESNPGVQVMPQVLAGSQPGSGFSEELANCVDRKDSVL